MSKERLDNINRRLQAIIAAAFDENDPAEGQFCLQLVVRLVRAQQPSPEAFDRAWEQTQPIADQFLAKLNGGLIDV